MGFGPIGVPRIASEENYPPFRVRVWFRVKVRIRVGSQFSSGIIVLEQVGLLKTSRDPSLQIFTACGEGISCFITRKE